ncbi:MAG: Lsr2 family protein [Streptosporangiaceae bacterium]|jgi:hypothetical protein
MFGKPKRLAAAEGLDPMARKITTTVVCDLPHDDEVVSKETVSFSFEGSAYEIDVCSAHAKELQDKFSAYTAHARRAGTGAARRRRARTGPGRERSAEIRAWARERGHKVSERGRIPATIISEYEAAH